ncbi:FAD-dependent monooxygenase [Cyanobium sp. NIES-981]|uniref:FAD-dependent monooxygenase n=1 Tax=Cyanobium sp. NIES-981 TaxID=1851505 RepID=UPI0007DD2681|nr:FAD-dependent monooxygenase [Cyanobium sp. NIES-981]SBO44745.1 Monooxygenase, FAD-binding protein [Cyanobium sp. NIES-981]
MNPLVVVGAGPAGACLALMLGRRGLPVVLVEAASSLGRQFRGEGLMPHGLAALEAMGLAKVVAAVPHRPLAGWRFCLDGQPLFRVAEPLEGAGHRPCTLVSQPALLEAVIAQLRHLPHARVLLGERVSALVRNAERISGVRLASGETLGAALVLACDGRQSKLRQLAGLNLELAGSPIDLLWFQLISNGGDSPDPLGGDFLTSVGREGIFSVFSSASGGLQLGWVLEADAPTPALSPQAWRQRMAAQSPPELARWLLQDSGPAAEPVRLRVEVGLAPRWWCPGLLLLGDAAHPMSPVRAQGLNLALRDACVAGQLLGERLSQGPAEPGELDAVLARIASVRRGETQALQRLQAREAGRGLLLQRHAALRSLLAAAAPWLGPPLARHWSHSQQALRHGLGNLEAAWQ